jgi:hypothetical protein
MTSHFHENLISFHITNNRNLKHNKFNIKQFHCNTYFFSLTAFSLRPILAFLVVAWKRDQTKYQHMFVSEGVKACLIRHIRNGRTRGHINLYIIFDLYAQTNSNGNSARQRVSYIVRNGIVQELK